MNELKRKKLTVLASVVVLLLAVLVVMNILLDGGFGKPSGKHKTDKAEIFLYEPDYDEDIFTDDEYMGLDRFITYTEGAITVRAVTDSDLKSAGKYALMFGDYFDSVIHGDAEKFNSFFTNEYIAENGLKDRFTMQKIYGVDIRKLSEITADGNGDLLVSVFEVRYAIFENNGTFRDDIASDTIRPQIYEVYCDLSSGKILINSISEYNRK